MKSLLFGIYQTNVYADFSKNIQEFNCGGARKITEYLFPKFSLYTYAGTTGLTIEENERYFIVLAGNNFPVAVNDFLSAEPIDIIRKLSDKIPGQYSLCLYDKLSEEVFVGTDFFGLFPLFYSQTTDGFLFSNEYQPLIRQGNKSADISLKNIIPYLEYGFSLYGKTFFENIHYLPAQQFLQSGKSGLSVKQYADYIPAMYETYEQSLEALYVVLKKTVNKLSEADNSHFATISGGLDTRIILALTNESTRKKQEYRTFYLAPLNETNDRDVLIGKLLAKEYNLGHKVFAFEEITDKYSPAYFETIRKERTENTLTGLYGGELLSGILYHKVFAENTSSAINSLYTTLWRKPFGFFAQERTLQKSVSHKNKRAFFFQTLSSSFFSSVYGGSEGGWLHPFSIAQRYFSPYIDTEFLKVWFAIPEEHLFDEKRSLYFDFYTKFIPEFKKIPTNSMLPNLAENGFTYFEEGTEPKQVKKSTSSHLLPEIRLSEGYVLIPEKYKSAAYLAVRNNQQRVIDFCVWYDYYRSFQNNNL